MHYLHKILVNVGGLADRDDFDRQELINQARSRAEQETESFYEHAFDWRETDTAGRWQLDYPENVILGAESPEKLLSEVVWCRNQQKAEMDECLKLLESYGTMPFSNLVQRLWEQATSVLQEGEPAEASFSIRMAVFHIKKLARFLDGEYFYDSCFYDTSEYTALISRATIQKIKEHPEDWALVFFDQHF